MGHYINTPVNHDKDAFLIDNYNALPINISTAAALSKQSGSDQVAICVVDNGPFEAAAIITDHREFMAFSRPSDHRPKSWLAMNKQEVLVASGHSPTIFE